jgi:uncharacterized membrane protein YccC
VRPLIKLWRRLRAFMHHRGAQLTLALRVTIAALVALVLAQWLELRLPLWAVLTAVIVTQMSVGKSLRATIDYFAGTLGGALYGGAIAVLLPHASELALLAVLALAIVPLAFIGAINPRFSTAPVTAIIVLLVPLMTHVAPLTSAIDRVIEVAVGGVTGLAVSFLLSPSYSHRLIAAAAARTLDQMAWALGQLLAGLTRGLDVDALHQIQDRIGQALAELNAMGREAEHERSARVAEGPDTGPLLRTLLRLRHDLVMIGRSALTPLPEPIGSRLAAPLQRIGTALADDLRASGAALKASQPPPSFDAVGAALAAYDTELAAVRKDGLTRSLSSDAAECFFALGFGLEQMHNNLKDMHRVVAEWAGPAKKA